MDAAQKPEIRKILEEAVYVLKSESKSAQNSQPLGRAQLVEGLNLDATP